MADVRSAKEHSCAHSRSRESLMRRHLSRLAGFLLKQSIVCGGRSARNRCVRLPKPNTLRQAVDNYAAIWILEMRGWKAAPGIPSFGQGQRLAWEDICVLVNWAKLVFLIVLLQYYLNGVHAAREKRKISAANVIHHACAECKCADSLVDNSRCPMLQGSRTRHYRTYRKSKTDRLFITTKMTRHMCLSASDLINYRSSIGI